MQEELTSLPYHQWIQDIVQDLGFYDLVGIPPIWEQIFDVLPRYLATEKKPDTALIWLFEGTGDDLPDLFLQMTRLKEELITRIQRDHPEKTIGFIKWFHTLELQLVDRCHKKNLDVAQAQASGIDVENERKKKKKWKTVLLRLLDTLPLGAILFNAEGDTVAINASLGHFTGVKAKKLRNISDVRSLILGEEQQIKIYKYFNRASRGEEFSNIPFSLKSAEGKPLHFRVHTLSCPNKLFLVLLVPEHCLGNDKSAHEDFSSKGLAENLKLLEAEERYSQCKLQLRNSFKIIERITRLLKVDIDNFNTFAILLAQEMGGKKDPESVAENMVEISASLDEMMENTVEYSQLSMKRLRYAPVQWDGSLAAEEVFSHLEDRLNNSTWADREIIIRSDIDSGIEVDLDFRIATEILWQLAVNALIYSDKQVEITARVENHNLVFSIEDHGTGMYKTDIERVFQPLIRLNPSCSRGLGLGLAIVSEYCDLSGYRVELTSVPNEGTIASLYLKGIE